MTEGGEWSRQCSRHYSQPAHVNLKTTREHVQHERFRAALSVHVSFINSHVLSVMPAILVSCTRVREHLVSNKASHVYEQL